ncbi:ATP-binding protein [Marinobacter sp. ATCH36]|uniref:ATP-binding protein n=1 Tax=Marinobacter sp. ATCH36 TaxID=2945106 RepID=UPI00201FE744|nr:ATP-binding protein [Marinobacter sp. ATCH36]MCL7944673.1 ATP-binding protein [Marinobacter sp. ATCH36]
MISAASSLEDASGFWIPTPMAAALKATLEQWIQCGHTGGVIIGEARLGKTRALKALGKQMTNRSGQPIHLFYMHYGRRDTQTVRAVFAKIAKSLGFDVKRQTADALLDCIVTRLGEAALANDTRQVVLIVDEAQLLTTGQLNAFAEIYNDLVNLNINCVVIFIANQDQFAELGRALLLRQNRYLRERFFNNLDYFYGIRSESELAECLAGYDAFYVTEHPRQTVTEYFCPDLAKDGWQLASLAPFYWRQFRERYGTRLGIASWGMAQFVRATNLLVMDYLPYCQEKDDLATQEAAIIKSLEAAGIEPSLVNVVGKEA